ncbi:MAG: DEAD/DEAH box helicase [Brevibacterium aurantiacum]|uniref:ATP-dependent RNA helicase DeaD n=2 Tax=Brevibacterium aurantiacum TaxID=273384 RepID=A0A1D7W4L5_BREAU|nr:DEAD/DEAH box helicase [Brevibacterium aurantiacum]MDN5593997.1 DEAD/DEAH box helicase [Brevibacterium sp.]AOP53989.1 DEAD-box ATP-dependent RNA helicase CshA [Brevibacterium aurantiacum]AZL09646.1 ATP-dependent RNA helicase [Brevibacterium aurantiacum]AZL13281.1 ATP-dependent RNA helicase [Brevibacterium aurantiacum]MDN6371927.1 DEAD/DEAH box helicase [Brevibacterium aurantiacum]
MTDVSSSDDPTTPKFSELGLHPLVLQAVQAQGYETPTPIQAETIPALVEGRDVIGLAQTGTGKTAAFALPALSDLAEAGRANDGPFALVLTPTRELAIQVAEAFTSYATNLDDFSVLPIYGGQAYGPQLSGLKRGAQVVVGTPGRVIDHLKKGSLKLGSLRHLILDEADEMLKMGFAEDIEEIFSQSGDSRQVALFSATMPTSIHRLTGKYLNNPKEVRVASKSQTGSNIRQRYHMVQHSHKLDALTRILEVEEYEGIIMFVRTKQATEELAEKLRARGFKASAINGDIPQQARERTIDMLRNGKVDILVATDVAARGLDVERITLVVNFDIPHDTESYVHRIGRTGRAGRSGEAILFVTPREQRLLGSIERATKQKVEQLKMPSVEELTNTRVEKFTKRIDDVLATTELTELATVIEQYELSRNVPATDIAAALASLVLESNTLKADPMPEPSRGKPGRDRDSGGRDGKPGRERSSRPRDENMTTYRLAIGRNERLQPGAVVGAIANEGGLTSKEIGHIDIRSNHTLVDLPKDLDSSVMRKLSNTQIQGRPIDIRPDSGRPARPFKKRNFDKQPGDSRNFRNDRRGGAKKFSNDRFGGERSHDRY